MPRTLDGPPKIDPPTGDDDWEGLGPLSEHPPPMRGNAADWRLYGFILGYVVLIGIGVLIFA